MILTKTQAALEVWASAWHHAAHGGTGHPPYNEITNEPTMSDETGEAVCSSLYYGATSSKYRERPPTEIDLDVLSEIEVVERALGKCGAPQWFRRYLLFKYPTVGRFVPARKVHRKADPEDHPYAFVKSGYLREVVGKIRSKKLFESLVRFVGSVEAEFSALLAREVANFPDYLREEPGPAARGDSPAQRETA